MSEFPEACKAANAAVAMLTAEVDRLRADLDDAQRERDDMEQESIKRGTRVIELEHRLADAQRERDELIALLTELKPAGGGGPAGDQP